MTYSAEVALDYTFLHINFNPLINIKSETFNISTFFLVKVSTLSWIWKGDFFECRCYIIFEDFDVKRLRPQLNVDTTIDLQVVILQITLLHFNTECPNYCDEDLKTPIEHPLQHDSTK